MQKKNRKNRAITDKKSKLTNSETDGKTKAIS